MNSKDFFSVYDPTKYYLGENKRIELEPAESILHARFVRTIDLDFSYRVHLMWNRSLMQAFPGMLAWADKFPDYWVDVICDLNIDSNEVVIFLKISDGGDGDEFYIELPDDIEDMFRHIVWRYFF